MLSILNNFIARFVYYVQRFFLRTPIKLQKMASQLTKSEADYLLDEGKKWKPTVRPIMLMRTKDLVREGNIIMAGQSKLSRIQRETVLWRLGLLTDLGPVKKHTDVLARVNIPVSLK